MRSSRGDDRLLGFRIIPWASDDLHNAVLIDRCLETEQLRVSPRRDEVARLFVVNQHAAVTSDPIRMDLGNINLFACQ